MSRLSEAGLVGRFDRFLFAVCSAWFFAAGVTVGQERFELEVPGQPELHSKAVVDAGTLTVTGPDGEVIRYRRYPARDAISYFAYYWRDGGQFIRFPESGSGAMFKSLDGIRWERSRMQVRPVGPVAGAAVPVRHPMHLDVLVHGAESFIGRIDRDGVLEFWHGHGDDWHRMGRFPNPRFVPGAPVKLTQRAGAELPTVFTISRSGQLLEVVEGANINPLSPVVPAQYVPGGYIALGDDLADRYLLAVRRPGEFFQLRDDGKASTANFGDVPVGSPIGVADNATDSFFFVDRFGKMHGRMFGTWGPVHPSLAPLPADFQPYGIISATSIRSAGGAVPTIHLVTVDKFGRLRVVFDNGLAGIQVETIDAPPLIPGQPVCTSAFGGILRIGFSTYRGQLVELHRHADGTWGLHPVAEGFPSGAPLEFRSIGGRLYCFAVDDRGNLAIGQLDGDDWYFMMGSHGAELAARLVERRVVPNAPAPAVTLEWKNTFRDPLYVEIHDLLKPGQPVAMEIAAGASVPQAIQPDGGVTFEDTYEIPVPGAAPKVEVRTYHQSARPRHKVLVWKNSVVATYIDRTKNKTEPDTRRRDLVSLGFFILPADSLLKDGDVISVYEEAKRANNPGAPEFRRE